MELHEIEIVFLQPQQIVPRLNPLEKFLSLFLELGCGAKYATLAAVEGRQAVDDQFFIANLRLRANASSVLASASSRYAGQ